MDNCDIGNCLSDPCHQLTYHRKKALIKFKDLKETLQEELLWRTGLLDKKDTIATICNHHEQLYGVVFERKSFNCCDPFKKHKKKAKGKVVITIDTAKTLQEKLINVHPGWKLCRNCYKDVPQPLEQSQTEEDEFISSQDEGSDVETKKIKLDNSDESDVEKQKLDHSFSTLGISPLKLKGVARHQRKSYAERKLATAVNTIKDNVSNVLKVDVELSNTASDQETLNKVNQKKAAELDCLISAINEKLQSTEDYKSKIQMLTLIPDSWSRKYAAEYFHVSEYLVRKARELKQKKGILSIPDMKRGKQLPTETLNKIHNFYQDDQYSRLMPGKKDYVSVKGLGHQQKRLLLCNIHELYIQFKKSEPELKVGFSKFCSLKPKWCVSAGATGTHSVCVCTHHQNAKLLVSAIKWDITYKDLMAKLVCDVNSNECMVHRCPRCPGIDALTSYLDEELKWMDDEDEFYMNQWQTTDRSTLITQTVSLSDYKELLISCVDKLTSHSYIARCQGKYLKDIKESLDSSVCIVLGDFAENYKFMIQDEIQSYHWNSEQCTLHPLVIYYKLGDNNELQEKSICFISDDMGHDTPFVYKVQKHTIEDFIKVELPQVKKVIYFSDGCTGQYKNYKNLLNLCYHREDFDLEAEWVFFATSHGKSPCDGIGGTVKRLTAKASLQRPIDQQILTVTAMLNFCKEAMPKIKFIQIHESDMTDVRKYLQTRFEIGRTVPGTRSFHHFVPLTNTKVAFKRTSEDKKYSGTFQIVKGESEGNADVKLNLKVMDYVACRYDTFWWIGLIDKIDDRNQDISIKFMHPHGPSSTFSWPRRDDYCWVPATNIISRIKPPSTTSGRVYKLSDADLETILNITSY